MRHLWPEADKQALSQTQSTNTDWLQSNPLLLSALESCVAARSLIEPEQAKLQPLIDEAADEVVLQARLYQWDLIGWQLNRAADVAEKRLAHFKGLRDFAAENERCARDTEHWFEYYAWTTDPRNTVLVVQPLALFDFQRPFIEWLDRITFLQQVSGVCEKSRTMGATEVTLRWMLKQWRYRDNFVALPLSANEDLVDSKKDPGTLFEKLRFQLRYLPSWMLPRGFNLDRDMPYMQLVNPENGSVLQGDAPTANVGRQRRAAFVLKDESAMWPNGGYQQHTALSRTANTICDISSVQGKFNKFAEIADDGITEKFVMDWHQHPWLDTRWFNQLPRGILGPAMTQQEIAQEILRDKDASQPGRVLKNVREEYCFITEDELVAAFPGREALFYDRDGRFVLPTDWNWGRVTDYGESAQKEDDTHIWAYSLFARPAERWPRWAVDSLFFFVSRPIEPIGATELEGYAFYSQLEQQLGLRDSRGFTRSPSVNDMSHEATDPKEVLLTKCGDYWGMPDLDFDKGRRKLVFHFEITDKHLPNPIRPELPGRTRIYFVAPKGSYSLVHADGRHFVTPSATQAAFRRLRAEIPAWHYPPEERGKPVPKMRPKSVFDDIITTIRYAVARWGVDAAPLNYQERLEVVRPQLGPLNQKLEAKIGLTPQEELQYWALQAQAKKLVNPSGVKQWNEHGQLVREVSSGRCSLHRQVNCQIC